MKNKDEMRKGPWTEQEDDQLVHYVKLFGDRRWDFIAKVSGLKRIGKSCRLRWVNYLHPGLKRGKMTPHEQRLVLELHSKLGNRWSKIAEKIPGRTDNEIKNYWRTHMRKKAQERKKVIALSQSSFSSNSSYSSTYNSPSVDINPAVDTTDRSFYDTGELDMLVADLGEKETGLEIEKNTKIYSLDEIWKEVELSEKNCNLTFQSMDSPIWDFSPNNSLWYMDEEENKILMKSMSGYPFHSFSSFNHKFI